MLRAMKAIVLSSALFVFGIPAAAQCVCDNWRPSFISGTVDDAGNTLDATEVRQFAVYEGKLYAATGSWMDQGKPKGTAKVIRLDASNGAWRQEADFGDGTTGGIVNLHWTMSKNQTPVDVSTLVASIWSGATVFAKNPADGKWFKTVLDPNGQIRTFATHKDVVANQFFGFAGGKPGIYRAQLADTIAPGQAPISWMNLELNTTNLNLPLCSGGGRVTGFAEARGKLYASACWRIFVRHDGPIGKCGGPTQVEEAGQCNPRWTRFWDDPLAAQGESGLRGLTKVMHQGQEMLLVGSESGNMHVTRLDPDTAQPVVEFNASDYLNDLWGLNSGYGILPYNSPAPLWYGPDGFGRRIFGFEVWLPGKPTPAMARKLVNDTQLMNGEGFFFVRNSATNYQLLHIPAEATPQPMTAVRDVVASPFKDECNAQGQDCVVYVGVFDANKSTTQTPCTVAPCTIPPLVAVPTHGTGAIVKGRITLAPNEALSAASTPEGVRDDGEPSHDQADKLEDGK